mmetsp:Transcript_18700/g.32467  ORF Transcript_18700/g.32467 Transcript_18700/m.32467 type:complete len:474 (+) Transcript_18700:599-2020(+)|eukprot:CAMPEP_0184700764 /NCGR_PEP_ID=MMETSP0313-20130426/15940_1 /TAXON_ID=2792 /ORGANISM="Porphyridium aerugineum, Strain SAG 1380-2" /LENGTH=473 /DNA_ID=CAMNT_0027160577 /DNA_START=593 /DNA_END=2014 /DNA_ORIENTATION=+
MESTSVGSNPVMMNDVWEFFDEVLGPDESTMAGMTLPSPLGLGFDLDPTTSAIIATTPTSQALYNSNNNNPQQQQERPLYNSNNNSVAAHPQYYVTTKAEPTAMNHQEQQPHSELPHVNQLLSMRSEDTLIQPGLPLFNDNLQISPSNGKDHEGGIAEPVEPLVRKRSVRKPTKQQQQQAQKVKEETELQEVASLGFMLGEVRHGAIEDPEEDLSLIKQSSIQASTVNNGNVNLSRAGSSSNQNSATKDLKRRKSKVVASPTAVTGVAASSLGSMLSRVSNASNVESAPKRIAPNIPTSSPAATANSMAVSNTAVAGLVAASMSVASPIDPLSSTSTENVSSLDLVDHDDTTLLPPTSSLLSSGTADMVVTNSNKTTSFAHFSSSSSTAIMADDQDPEIEEIRTKLQALLHETLMIKRCKAIKDMQTQHQEFAQLVNRIHEKSQHALEQKKMLIDEIDQLKSGFSQPPSEPRP